MIRTTALRLAVVLCLGLLAGTALGWGVAPGIALTAVVALLAHERRVVRDWRQAPVRLAAPR